MAPKPNGQWRPCGDYRKLNAATKYDAYPVPHIHDLNIKLAGAKVFSLINLHKGFHGIPMNEADICKTCLLYTSPSPRDKRQSRMPSSA